MEGTPVTSSAVGPTKLHLSLPLAALLLGACGGPLGGNGLSGEPDAYGAAYQGDGVQCGAIVCSGSQQCCLVYVAADANASGPTHACDQDCQSICADTCPDAGGMTQSFPPSGTGMPGMGGIPGGGPAPLMEGGMPAPMPPGAGAMSFGPNPPGTSGTGPVDADTDF